MNLRAIAVATDSVTFADPSNIFNTTRFKTHAGSILVNGTSVPFTRVELISSRQAEITLCDTDCKGTTPTSVRIYVSGPIVSKDAIVAQLEAAVANLKTAIQQDNVLGGFPVNAATAYIVDVAPQG